MAGSISGIEYTQLIDYAGGTSAIYLGWALPGVATSAAMWKIQKITYDTNGLVTAIKWASGSDAFNKIWDSRAGYSYS